MSWYTDVVRIYILKKKKCLENKKDWAGNSERIPSVSLNQALWKRKKKISHIRTFITIFFFFHFWSDHFLPYIAQKRDISWHLDQSKMGNTFTKGQFFFLTTRWFCLGVIVLTLLILVIPNLIPIILESKIIGMLQNHVKTCQFISFWNPIIMESFCNQTFLNHF